MPQRGSRAVRTKEKPNYERDVRNPLFKEAEERVYQWLVSAGKHVTDNRSERTFHDFTVGHAWTLDVKCDRQAHDTGCVAWEQGVAMHDGPIREGWGLHPGLNYVVYVLVPPEGQRDGRWPVLVCSAKRLRGFAEANRETDLARGFLARGTDRDGFGFLLDIQALRDYGAVLEEGEV